MAPPTDDDTSDATRSDSPLHQTKGIVARAKQSLSLDDSPPLTSPQGQPEANRSVLKSVFKKTELTVSANNDEEAAQELQEPLSQKSGPGRLSVAFSLDGSSTQSLIPPEHSARSSISLDELSTQSSTSHLEDSFCSDHVAGTIEQRHLQWRAGRVFFKGFEHRPLQPSNFAWVEGADCEADAEICFQIIKVAAACRQ